MKTPSCRPVPPSACSRPSSSPVTPPFQTNMLLSSLYDALRPYVFQLDPEVAHERTFALVESLARVPGSLKVLQQGTPGPDPRLMTRLWGHVLPSPIGIAAGFDKDARIYNALFALGFSAVEVGTVTPRPQPGNPKPRLFRLPEDEALINRFGFNNAGAAAMQQRLQQQAPQGLLGVNLGKNKDTPLAEAPEDYVRGLEAFHGLADYLVINISSPNTENLRSLQSEAALQELLDRCFSRRDQLAQLSGKATPLLVKLAPDWEAEALEQSLSVLQTFPLDGVVATNTTLDRAGLQSRHRDETGGLSGRPLQERSTAFIRHLRSVLPAEMPILGVGGVFTGADVHEKLQAGATLVQVYTSLIYRGPGLARMLQQELLAYREATA